MYKLFVAIVFAFTFMACQGDGAEDQMSQAPSMQQENPMQQNQTAQTEVSDEELENFLGASTELREVQMGSQQEMIAVVEEEGLTVEVYNTIAEAEQTGQSTDDLEVSSEDLEKYERASEQIAEMEQEIESELEQIIEENGMGMDRFQEINMALQQNPVLQQRIQQMMQESGSMQQQTPPTEQN